jgi:hypothetical protein
MKRYSIQTCSGPEGSGATWTKYEDAPDGEWVKYEDATRNSDDAPDKAWSVYFRQDGESWRCIKHEFQDVDGGLCPSCARYAFNLARHLWEGLD